MIEWIRSLFARPAAPVVPPPPAPLWGHVVTGFTPELVLRSAGLGAAGWLSPSTLRIEIEPRREHGAFVAAQYLGPVPERMEIRAAYDGASIQFTAMSRDTGLPIDFPYGIAIVFATINY